jgi:hypothetical protein
MHRITAMLLASVMAALAQASAARAQGLHLSTEPARPTAGTEIRVTLSRGMPFAGEVLSADAARGVRLQRLWRSGRSDLEPDPATGVARFRATEPGVQLVAFGPRGDGGGSGEVASFGKALVVVGGTASNAAIWRSELGQELEIVPETDPVTLAESGGSLQVQVLFDREPLAGATVVAVAESPAGDSYLRSLTDTLGRARFDLDRPGRWLVHLAHKGFERGDEPGWALYHSSLLLFNGP